ncbi:hypothetical protein PSD17_25640 [Pseudonocardia sp. D17]|nr:hypothetical protein PSD17_25640 [Pseudonocardia sp. D17]
MLWELKPGEVEYKVEHLETGDACPHCGSHDCEYRAMQHPTRKGYMQVGLDCHTCGKKTIGACRDYDQESDFSPVPLPK